jgi:hypothetical protein
VGQGNPTCRPFGVRISSAPDSADGAAHEVALWQPPLSRPDAGVVIPGSGGLRKLRWALGASGKRGGARLIYYWAVAPDRPLMLNIYPKNV